MRENKSFEKIDNCKYFNEQFFVFAKINIGDSRTKYSALEIKYFTVQLDGTTQIDQEADGMTNGLKIQPKFKKYIR